MDIKSFVILPAKEFEALLETLEELEDIRIYYQAKEEDNGDRIPMEEAFTIIESKRKEPKE